MKRKRIVLFAILLVVVWGLSACTALVAGLTMTEKKPVMVQNRISEQEAQQIALEHAGFSAEDDVLVFVESDYEDGKPVYEVTFHAGFTEYEYQIHAETGKIMSVDIDN